MNRPGCGVGEKIGRLGRLQRSACDGDELDRDEDGPERTCIVTRRKASPDEMLRFVAGPDALVVPDIRRRLPGRGVWVTTSQVLVAEAVKRGAFARGLKTKVRVETDLPQSVGDLLAVDALQSLAMANKAGAVVSGFFKVEAALVAGPVAVVLHAAEAADDGVRKLEAARRRRLRQDPGPIAVEEDEAPMKVFSSQQLDLALGRTNVIHAALAAGSAGHAFLVRCRRLVQYRSAPVSAINARAEKST